MPTSLVIRNRHLTQTNVSLKGYLLAPVTKTRIRFIFRLGWIQVLRYCHQDSLSLSSYPLAQFFFLDFVLKRAISHMAICIPAAPASVLVAQQPQWKESFFLPIVSANVPGLALIDLYGSHDYCLACHSGHNFNLGRRVSPIQLRRQKSCYPREKQVGDVRTERE